MARRSPLLSDGRALLDAERLLAAGLADRRASFELSFARLPAHWGFAVIAGVETLLETLSHPLVVADDVERARRTGLISEALGERLLRPISRLDLDTLFDG